MDLNDINKAAFRETVKREIMFIKKVDKETRKANYNLGGQYINNCQANNTAVNRIMNLPLFIDVNGDDATQDVHDDIADNYGLEDVHNAIDNLQYDIDNTKKGSNELKQDKIEMKYLSQVCGDWAENHGYNDKRNINNYYTDVTYPVIYGWVKDIIKILHADENAIEEA